MVAPFNPDQPTSQAAAESLSRPMLNQWRRRILDHLIACGPAGATHREIEQATGIRGDTQRPRLRELVELGHVRDSGTVRRNPVSQRWAVVWVAVG